jgi:hypothetical protein
LCHAKRDGAKKFNVSENLGRVIDKEKGVFQNRKRGMFTFSPNTGYGEVEQPSGADVTRVERLILDFGDSFLFDEILKSSGFERILRCILPEHADTVMAMVAFKVLNTGFSNRYAQEWLDGSYAGVLYPKAAMQSQRISDFLKSLGNESCQRRFFKDYLDFLSKGRREHGILVDSTGLPNDIHFPLTAINTHNGVTSVEARLIYVLDRESGMPLYFRYAAGNIVDVSTLQTTLTELRAYGVDVNYAIVDAGYYSEGNIGKLQEAGIPYLVRMIPNRKLYKELVKAHAETLEDARHLVRCGERLVYIKREKIALSGKDSYAYVALDIDRKHDELKKYYRSAITDKDITAEEMNSAAKTKGLFILLSAEAIETKDVLPLYYTRQSIEQVFDIGKNNADLLPLRVHSEETFRGHLMLSFLSSIAYILANQRLEGSSFCALGAFHLLRNLKCKVFEKNIIVSEATKKMNDLAKHLKLGYPKEITLW